MLCVGRDPLLYVSKKVDIAAVASVLKGYFRELSIPLFPTENYKAFIKCTRESCHCTTRLHTAVYQLPYTISTGHDDIHSRLEAIQNTLTLVDPAVVKVMRFLFKFLFRYTGTLHTSTN